MKPGEFNIIIGDPPDRDIHLCFGQAPPNIGFTERSLWETSSEQDFTEWTPAEAGFTTDICDHFLQGSDEWQWPQLLKAIGAFPSAGQARKNGWNKPIDDGFSEIKVGRRKICVLKCTEEFLKSLEE